jgi:ABC-type polysaccharide/polyol phosphate transport system ATPase subunit
MAPLFEAQGLGKRYTIRPERSLALGLVKRNRPHTLWALRGVDLEVNAGEVVSVIGRNGAGKSTFLKLASGVTKASEGTIRRPEFIAPLIEVGAGFHPELTGRENVEVNGRLLGLSAAQIKSRFDEIVEFAELAHAIDQPVKQYSSGMFMRLGFAVAVHTEPELLVVDEVLAVGDLPFQLRCLDRIRAMKADGVGVLFVSHNLTAVLSLADRAVLLERGQVHAEGGVADVVGAYHALLATEGGPGDGAGDDAPPTNELRLDRLEVVDDEGAEVLLWHPGQRVTVRMHLTATAPVAGGLVGFRLQKEGAGLVAGWHETDVPSVPPLDAGESVVVSCAFDLNVTEGGYLLDLAIARPDWSAMQVARNGAHRFGVAARRGSAGIADLAPTVDVDRAVARP